MDGRFTFHIAKLCCLKFSFALNSTYIFCIETNVYIMYQKKGNVLFWLLNTTVGRLLFYIIYYFRTLYLCLSASTGINSTNIPVCCIGSAHINKESQ